jgi:hypothetical protein
MIATLPLPRVLTVERYRSSHYIQIRFSDDPRPIRPRIAPDEYRIRPHSGQTMLPQRPKQQEENREN